VGVLIASAILDTGSRASAAYLSTASRSVGSGAGTRTDEAPADPSRDNRERDERHLVTNQPASAGTSSSSNAPSNPTSQCADLPPKEPPPGNLVAYFREPAVRLELTKYIDSILDPPRQV